MEAVIRISAALIINRLWLIHTKKKKTRADSWNLIYFLSGVILFLRHQLLFLDFVANLREINVPTKPPLHVPQRRCLLLAGNNISRFRRCGHWQMSPTFSCRTASESVQPVLVKAGQQSAAAHKPGEQKKIRSQKKLTGACEKGFLPSSWFNSPSWCSPQLINGSLTSLLCRDKIKNKKIAKQKKLFLLHKPPPTVWEKHFDSSLFT